MSAHPIDWSKVPHTNLVSDSEDDAEVVEAKAGEKQRREEEAKAERQRQKEVRKVEEAWRAEEARRAEEAQRVKEERWAETARQVEAARRREEAERQKAIDEAWARMERGNAGTIDSSSSADTEGVREVHGLFGGTQRKARKACVWPLGLVEVTAAMGSRTEGSRKPVPRCVVKQRTATTTNVLPRGGEKCKKAHTTTEEGKDDEDTKEVFGVPRAMAEEQRDALGMLTQMLAQVAERLAATEVRDEERLAIEREWMEIWRAHLVIARRAPDQDEERLELERVRTSLSQQWTEDLWWMGTLMQSPFVYLAKGKEKEVETEVEVEAEEKGDEADDKDKDVQGKEE
ncbi:hypothetical protein SCLCIDRAFT_28419 [Scleroderma citrinum Foug A]|uniref:Uncharacterized protein n=1 Tax=Scleroderma citrinum Foug A TaxID=1036808 RepID=A0A0C3DPB7_9AGAM|nr:hypothetical protein SCLCIDRAFT_28419 [Scleroderma citrinum Foug A]